MPHAPIMQRNHLYSVFFAPRGSVRIYELGINIAQQYLSPADKLIGIIGEAGSGKSILVKGMFPGLELSNDDEGVNVRPLPLLSLDEATFYSPHTYHIDMRFESAFTQMHVLADAVISAINKGKRVIVEHFDLLFPIIGRNANLLIGVGEEIIVTRPTLFGPEPQDIAEIVFKSVKFRKMAHTAEDLCEHYMLNSSGIKYEHSDVKHGFVLSFDHKPDLDLIWLEKKVKEAIEEDISISYHDENHILIGEEMHVCTGPRTHVRSTGEIENFKLLKDFPYDSVNDRYLMVGLVGTKWDEIGNDLNRISF